MVLIHRPVVGAWEGDFLVLQPGGGIGMAYDGRVLVGVEWE